MIQKASRYYGVIAAVVVQLALFTGCESQRPKTSAEKYAHLRNIVPTAEKDRAPSQPRDVSAVSDAVPRVEPRTAAGNFSPYKVKGIVYYVMDDPRGYEAYGEASWYGEKFHGNRTSNGEIYDMYTMTAAHKTLPIPSYVRVTNVENGKSIIARVNDRGPFAHGRIIDLSYAGAYKLGYLDAGTAKVKVQYIDPLAFHASREEASGAAGQSHADGVTQSKRAPNTHIATSQPKRYLQVGAFGSEQAALSKQYGVARFTEWPVFVEQGASVDNKVIYRVYVGPFPSEERLDDVKAALVKQGLPRPLRVVK